MREDKAYPPMDGRVSSSLPDERNSDLFVRERLFVLEAPLARGSAIARNATPRRIAEHQVCAHRKLPVFPKEVCAVDVTLRRIAFRGVILAVWI